jgi:hypothetical protein
MAHPIIALLALVLLSSWTHGALAAHWQEPVEVVYIETGSPLPAGDVSAALAYAVDAWTARVDVPMQYSDAPAESGYQRGKIVVRWVDTLEMVRNGSNILSLAATRRWVYNGTQAIAGVEIYLHRASFRSRADKACLTHVILHEMGHALGIGHLPEAHSLMYASMGDCHHTLTTEDIAAAPYPQHICHAQLLPNFDIYVPVITIRQRSFSGRLQYSAGIWSLTEYREVAYHPECSDSYVASGDLILNKVRAQDHVWKGELAALGGNTWMLKFAY